MIYVFIGTDGKLLSFSNLQKIYPVENISFKPKYFVMKNKTESILKSKIREIIDTEFSENKYKTKQSLYGTNNAITSFFKIKNYFINYVTKTHFTTSINDRPSDMSKELYRKYLNETTKEIKNINLDRNTDSVYVVDLKIKLSNRPSNSSNMTNTADRKTIKKSKCLYHKNKYKQYKKITRNKIKNKLNRTRNSRNSRNSRNTFTRNNSSSVYSGNNNANMTRKKRQIKQLSKQKMYYNNRVYRSDFDYLKELRKKVQSELLSQ